MKDLFERQPLAAFMAEEAKSLGATGDLGLIMAALSVSKLMKEFQTALVGGGVLSALMAGPAEEGAADTKVGQETVLRAYALLVVAAGLGLRDVAGRLNMQDDFPEIDLLVTWYRNRWPR